MSKGLDTTQNCTPHITAIKAAGYSFVCRYASHSAWKNLSPDEAEALSRAGIEIVTVWEVSDKAEYLTRAQGLLDGAASFAFGQHVGQPFVAPMYYAIDMDVNPQATVPYFDGVRTSLQRHGQIGKDVYNVRSYGSGAVCKYLKELGLTSGGWLAQSAGWQGFDWPDWDIKQGPAATIAGMNADSDESNGNGGGWMLKV